jgi:hypothetical protein
MHDGMMRIGGKRSRELEGQDDAYEYDIESGDCAASVAKCHSLMEEEEYPHHVRRFNCAVDASQQNHHHNQFTRGK